MAGLRSGGGGGARVAGCVPGRSATPGSTPEWHAAAAPSRTRACPPGAPSVQLWLPDPTDVSVRVYNGTSRPDLANQVAEELTTRGFKVLSVATSDRPYPQTHLRQA